MFSRAHVPGDISIHNSFTKGSCFIHHSPSPLWYEVIVCNKQTYFSLNIPPRSLFPLKQNTTPAGRLPGRGRVLSPYNCCSMWAIRMARITATASSGASTMATPPLNRVEGTLSTTAPQAALAVMPPKNMEL